MIDQVIKSDREKCWPPSSLRTALQHAECVTPDEDNTAAVNTAFRFPMSELRPIKPHMVR